MTIVPGLLLTIDVNNQSSFLLLWPKSCNNKSNHKVLMYQDLIRD